MTIKKIKDPDNYSWNSVLSSPAAIIPTCYYPQHGYWDSIGTFWTDLLWHGCGQWSLSTFNNSLLQYDSKCTFQCDSRRGGSMKRQFCSSSPHVSVSLLVSLPFFLKNFFVFPKLYQCPGSWLWQADTGTKTVNDRRKNKTQFVYLPYPKIKA